jgi:hypothetical protein
MVYSFGVPGYVIWTTHILIGIILFYMGWELNHGRPLPEAFSIGLMIVGAMVATYHSHLALINM